MSQHFIHVRVTDAPTWNRREREKEKQRRPGRGIKAGRREKKMKPSNNKGETGDKGKADKKRDIWVNLIISFFVVGLLSGRRNETIKERRLNRRLLQFHLFG